MYVITFDTPACFFVQWKMNLRIVSQQIFVSLSLLTDSALLSSYVCKVKRSRRDPYLEE